MSGTHGTAKQLPNFPVLLAVILLVACGDTSPEEQTLAAIREINATQQAYLQATATVERARLQITLEHAETRVARAGTQQGEIIATLQERGTAIVVIPDAATLVPQPTREEMPILNVTEPTLPAPTPVIEVTPFNLTPTVSPVPAFSASEPLRLREVVMATGVGFDDCATVVTNQFTPNSERIYVVARAFDIAAGTVISARWLRDGIELTAFDFVPDFVIEDACIWFFVDQTDFAFEPGSYSVDLFLNGAPAAPSIPFTITGGTDGS